MRIYGWFAIVLLGCKPAVAPVVKIEPADGSTLSSRCPIRVVFSKTINSTDILFGGTISGKVAVLQKTTSVTDDTLEFYPELSGWKVGEQTFSFELSILSGGGKVSTKYTVTQEPDELWKRSPSHGNATFVQGAIADVWFADATHGWAVGAGLVLRTTDGGATWSNVVPDSTRWYLTVTGIDASNVWVMGSLGEVLVTHDAGATWARAGEVPTGVSGSHAFAAIDANTVLAANSRGLFRGDNSASTFTEAKPGRFGALWVQSATSIWALGEGALHHSADQGATWTSTPTTLPLTSLTSDSAGTLWAAGGNETIAMLSDAGSFEVVHMRDGGEPLVDLEVDDPQKVWAIDTTGHGLHTGSDGGLERGPIPEGAVAISRGWISGGHGLAATTDGVDWNTRVPANDRDLFSIWLTDAQRITTVGGNGVVLTSANAGATWALRDAGTTDTLIDLWGIDNQLWASGLSGTILYSSNNGDTWSVRSSVPQETHAIFGVDADHLWTVGDNCGAQGTEVFRSTDGARTWQSTRLAEVYCLLDVWASDTQHLWAVGDRLFGGSLTTHAVVEKSDDGGATWTEIDLGPGVATSIWGADASRLWITGFANNGLATQGLVVSTINGGSTWIREFWGAAGFYSDVWTSNANVTWAVGGETGPGILSTAGVCQVPAAQPIIGPEAAQAVHGTPDGKHVWLAGKFGMIANLDRP